MIVDLALQIATRQSPLPGFRQLQQWASAGLPATAAATAMTIRIVDLPESRQLNETYRATSGPTNVLSFPSCLPEHVQQQLPARLLGDLVICAPLAQREAKSQQKSLFAHWAHLVVHGMLHLQGYDHETDAQTLVMENLEVVILRRMGFANPYKASGVS